MTRMRSILITAGVGLAISLCACGNGPPEVAAGGGGPMVGSAAASGLGTPATKVIANASDQFSPGNSSVTTGQVIQWTVASDSNPHNVTFDSNGDITSPGSLGPGDTWQVKFTVPGTYSYRCTIHDGMNGQITVTAGSGGSSSAPASPSSSSSASASPSASPTPSPSP
ncbi:MAG: plastocyanin/azurin family copper-binding protein [Candidatus Dormibacteraeota bacterium]|nr:plastocyanin/azurin family copper-binding protein [Candidatus Dormibacteraeota bacterium]